MTDYPLIAQQLTALVEGCPMVLPTLSNCAALLWHGMKDINWAGFYLLLPDGSLVLGPFQGKVACTCIGPGKGVCGAAAGSGETQLVPDVHLFPGHIACDSASAAEIVLPLIKDGRIYGVMDIDSPVLGRFTQTDAEGLQVLCDTLMQTLPWEKGLLA